MANGPHYPATGGYLLRIVDQALGKSAQKGTPQFSVKVKVLGKVDPENPDNFFPDGRQFERTINVYFTEKSIDGAIATIKALGFTGTSFKFLDKATQGFHDFTGVEAEGYCEHEAGVDGKLYEKWNFSRPGGGKALDVTRLEDKERRELDNLFGKNLAASTPKQVAAPATGNHSADDIGF